MNDDEYQCAMDDAAALGFWSGVRACMLVAARERYMIAARIVCRAIRNDDVWPCEEWAFWDAVRDLQLLGEVGGEP